MARKNVIGTFCKYVNFGKVKRAMIEGELLRRTRKTLWLLICKTFRKIEEAIDLVIGKAARNIVLKKIPVQDNLVVFWSFQGDYTDNPKYIAEELIRRNTDCELIWIGRSHSANHLEQFPAAFSHVYEMWSWESFVALAKAKVLVVNSVELFKRPYPKKDGQYIIETWHGSLGIKRFDKSANSNKVWVRAAELSSKICDYLVSNSTFETDIYRSTFWPNQEVWEVGHPRNDCLVNCSETQQSSARAKLFSYIGKPDNGEKLFLYAPTFRDDVLNCYNLRSDELINALEARFGGKWIGIYRHHPTSRNLGAESVSNNPHIFDFTDYPDMQDLLQAADIGITDYSSWIYDFMLTKRPAFIFATDMKLYNTERGFAYPLQTTPFPIAENNAEMIDNILNFDLAKYEHDRSEFVLSKGCFEDGHASEKVVDNILRLMKSI